MKEISLKSVHGTNLMKKRIYKDNLLVNYASDRKFLLFMFKSLYN